MSRAKRLLANLALLKHYEDEEERIDKELKEGMMKLKREAMKKVNSSNSLEAIYATLEPTLAPLKKERQEILEGKLRVKQQIKAAASTEKPLMRKVSDIPEKASHKNLSGHQQDAPEATSSANKEAFRIANGYKRKKKPIPYFSIAEQMMVKYFKDLIQRETGKRMKNRQMELMKEWKDKREAIRVTLRQKFKNKRTSGVNR